MAQDIFLLKCRTQQYEWGKIGNDSTVAQLSRLPIQESEPYAVDLGEKNILLSDWLKEHPEAMGDAPIDSGHLPFLFKVLSIKKGALSIQAHPDKTLAAELHKNFPDLYKDPNHKPELALALTDMEALCSFRPFAEIQEFVAQVPEFRQVLGTAAEDIRHVTVGDTAAERVALERSLLALQSADGEAAAALACRVASQSVPTGPTATNGVAVAEQVAARIHSDFPDEGGVFGVFLLNYLRLSPGDAIFLAANEPHAYLRGDCAECMAASDNVVRLGLTPKFKDAATLTRMLTYRTGAPPVLRGDLKKLTKEAELPLLEYVVPVEEFLLQRGEWKAGTRGSLGALRSPSIALVLRGALTVNSSHSKLSLQRGHVIFLPAHTTVSVETSQDTMLLRCCCNLS